MAVQHLLTRYTRGKGGSIDSVPSAAGRRLNLSLAALLALTVVRLWLMPLPSSFWTDETGTVFMVHYGVSEGWKSISPELPGSLYYPLARAAEAIGGYSEAVLRLPSTLALGVALLLIARLSARLIHPQAAWFAAFLCLAMHGFNFQAADARPYALGTMIMAAGLWFLVRWLDNGRARDAALFLLFAALLWPVHPLFGPFYLVFVGYAIARLAAKDTPVTWLRAGVVFLLLGVALLPVLFEVLAMTRRARTHVITQMPGLKLLFRSVEPVVVGGCLAGAWLVARLFRWPRGSDKPDRPLLALIALWWLCCPLTLFGFSHLSGISVFVPRYYSLALPGAAFAGMVLAAWFVPGRMWKPLALVLGLGVLLARADWHEVWPAHTGMDYRGAADAINQLAVPGVTPVICPSPFVEGREPLWKPGYSLPSIVYAHLTAYPVRGRIFPFPFETSPDAERYAADLARSTLRTSTRFFVYGHEINAYFWDNWYKQRPELAGWRSHRVGPSGDVVVMEFDPPGSK